MWATVPPSGRSWYCRQRRCQGASRQCRWLVYLRSAVRTGSSSAHCRASVTASSSVGRGRSAVARRLSAPMVSCVRLICLAVAPHPPSRATASVFSIAVQRLTALAGCRARPLRERSPSEHASGVVADRSASARESRARSSASSIRPALARGLPAPQASRSPTSGHRPHGPSSHSSRAARARAAPPPRRGRSRRAFPVFGLDPSGYPLAGGSGGWRR